MEHYFIERLAAARHGKLIKETTGWELYLPDKTRFSDLQAAVQAAWSAEHYALAQTLLQQRGLECVCARCASAIAAWVWGHSDSGAQMTLYLCDDCVTSAPIGASLTGVIDSISGIDCSGSPTTRRIL